MSEFTRRQILQLSAAAAAASAGGCAAAGNKLTKDDDSPLADLLPMTEGLAPFEGDVYATRRAKLQKSLAAAGASAVFLGPTLNLTYFTGKSWGVSERLFGCLIFATGQSAWIAPRFEESRARETVGENGELYTWAEWENPHALLSKITNDRASGGVLAIDSHLRATHAMQFTNIRGANSVADALPITAAVRSVKTEPELARMRRACEITKKAIATVRERLIKPGVTEQQASAWVNEAQRRLGLVNTWALVLFGPNAAFPHGTKERRPLEAGQLALFDCGGELEGYQSDITRTYFIGDRPSDRQRTIFNLVRRAQIAALEKAKPGAKCEIVDAAARKIISDGGFGPGAKFFTHRLGHGIGLEGHEDPYFCGGNDTILQPGMTLSNEPGIYIPGELGVRLEDIIVITEKGCEVLGGELAAEM